MTRGRPQGQVARVDLEHVWVGVLGRVWTRSPGAGERLARRLLRLFIELNRLGTAVVIATHDLGLMEQVDARRLILAGGRLDVYD